MADIKKLIQKTINVERTSLGGQEQILYLEEVDEETNDKDVENSFNQNK